MTLSTRLLRLLGCGPRSALGCGQQQNPPPAPPPSVTSVADASSESKIAASEIDELLAPRPKDSTSPFSEDTPGGSLAADSPEVGRNGLGQRAVVTHVRGHVRGTMGRLAPRTAKRCLG